MCEWGAQVVAPRALAEISEGSPQVLIQSLYGPSGSVRVCLDNEKTRLFTRRGYRLGVSGSAFANRKCGSRHAGHHTVCRSVTTIQASLGTKFCGG